MNKGTVTATGAGEAEITVTISGTDISATCKVSVEPVEVEAITLSESQIVVENNRTYTLTAEVLPSNATDKTLLWSSSDETVAIPFASSSYTVTAAEDNKSMDVTYTDIGGQSYQVINSLVETEAGANVFTVKIKNNGTETVNVRINVLKDGKNINIGATQDGVGVRTDMEWGGSFFTVAAGSTIDAVVYFGDSATEIQFMVDSSLSSAEAHSGNITVSEYRIGEATPVEA